MREHCDQYLGLVRDDPTHPWPDLGSFHRICKGPKGHEGPHGHHGNLTEAGLTDEQWREATETAGERFDMGQHQPAGKGNRPMADRNLQITDIDQWAQQAPPDQVIQATHKLLDRVGSLGDTHRKSFQQNMSPQGRKLFQGEPVG